MMDDQSNIGPQSVADLLRHWGIWALLAGGIALILVFFQIVGPTLETKQSAATQIGEIAGEIRRSAWRSFLGLPKPEPEIVAPPISSYLALVAPVLGVVAIILSVISGLFRENWRYAVYGASLGASAIVFQYLWWVALLIASVILLVSIIENIGDIFSF
ncbi:MAG: hypothetical protein AAFN51_08370 [Pseudomonadota bacterium]